MVGDDSEILPVLRDFGDGGANAGQHVLIVRLQQTDDELQTADETSDHFARIGGVFDAGHQRPGGVGLHLCKLEFIRKLSGEVKYFPLSISELGIP